MAFPGEVVYPVEYPTEPLDGKVVNWAHAVDESVWSEPAAPGLRHTCSFGTLTSEHSPPRRQASSIAPASTARPSTTLTSGHSPRRQASFAALSAQRPSTEKSVSLWGGDTMLLPPVVSFAAEPEFLLMNRDSLLRTSLGDWLMRRRLMAPLLLAVSVLIVLITTLEPLAEDVPADGPLYVQRGGSEQTLELRIRRAGEFTWIVKEVAAVFLWFLMLHNINRDLCLKVLHTFDALVIIASFVVGETARFYDLFGFWGGRGYVDRAWVAFEVLDTLLVTMPSALILVSMDSWKVSSWVRGERLSVSRIVLAAFAIIIFAKNYFDTILPPGVHKWSREPACLGDRLCKDPREIFGSAEVQKVIFLSKAAFKYSIGWPFAFIRPVYGLNDEKPNGSVVKMVSCGAGSLGRRLSSLMTVVGVRLGGRSAATAPDVAGAAEEQ